MKFRFSIALLLSIAWGIGFTILGARCANASNTEYIKASGNKFVGATTGNPFVPLGSDDACNIMTTYWGTTVGWAQIVTDFTYLQSLGVNVVRVFPQFSDIMSSATTTNSANLTLLGNLVDLADSLTMRLDITGLSVFSGAGPAWSPTPYDSMTYTQRWTEQELYWEAISAEVNATKPYAVFCYDLCNEPQSPSSTTAGTESSWYTGDDAGYYFDQYITETITTNATTAATLAQTWTYDMAYAIQHNSTGYTGDTNHMITVGELPQDLGYGNFIPSDEAKDGSNTLLNFISTHVYPAAGEAAVTTAINQVNDCDTGEPIVVEETMDGSSTAGQESQFILGSSVNYGDPTNGADGYITHFVSYDTIYGNDLLEDSNTLSLFPSGNANNYENMLYLIESPDYGFEYPNLNTIAPPVVNNSTPLTKTGSGGSIPNNTTCYFTCTYTWYSGYNQTSADTSLLEITTTSASSEITTPSVTLPIGATGLAWYASTSASGPFYYEGAPTVTSGVAAAATYTSIPTSGSTPPAFTSVFLWSPPGTPWTFTAPSGNNASGISNFDSAYTGMTTPAVEGSQVAFLQGQSELAESVYLQNGVNYAISFQADQRQGITQTAQTFYVELNGADIGSLFTPASSSSSYTTYTTSSFNTGSGASGFYTISFNGQDSTNSTALIDDVLITPVNPVLDFNDPAMNDTPFLNLAPLGPENLTNGTSSPIGGSLASGTYYLSCIYAFGGWPFANFTATTLSGSLPPIVTTGTTSSITTPSVTAPAGMTYVLWFAASSSTGTQYFQGDSAVSGGVAPPLTITSLATSGGTLPSLFTYGIGSATGGFLAARSYYLTCTYAWGAGPFETTAAITSNAVVTTGTTSSIITEPITLPSNLDSITGVKWYASTSSSGPFYYQGAATVTSGVAASFTITTLATSGSTPPTSGEGYIWDPAYTAWTYSAHSGNNGSGVCTPGVTGITGSLAIPSPATQTSMLEGLGTISQSMYLKSGVTYSITFDAVQASGNGSNETFTVYANGSSIGSFTPSSYSTGYTTYTTSGFTVPSAGNYTIEFEGTSSAAEIALINNVSIVNLANY